MIGALRADPDVARGRVAARAVLERLELGDKRMARAGALTLPDRKRLEVARALATGPKLLLLDEVMAGLRPTETDRMVAILRELNRDRGMTILLIEHVMRAVMALASRILVLHHGAAIAEGAPTEVTRDRAVIDSYLGAEAI
jgi:branched-chain amino acid transport system ATP-binding protein